MIDSYLSRFPTGFSKQKFSLRQLCQLLANFCRLRKKAR